MVCDYSFLFLFDSEIYLWRHWDLKSSRVFDGLFQGLITVIILSYQACLLSASNHQILMYFFLLLDCTGGYCNKKKIFCLDSYLSIYCGLFLVKLNRPSYNNPLLKTEVFKSTHQFYGSFLNSFLNTSKVQTLELNSVVTCNFFIPQFCPISLTSKSGIILTF